MRCLCWWPILVFQTTMMKKHLSEKAQMHLLKELVAHVASESRIQVDEHVRWNIPEIAKYSECGLSSVSVSTLQRCLQPVLEGLRQIDATELLGLEYVTVGPQIKEGVFVRPIHNLITPACDPGTVRYIHLAEVEGQYSMGVFIFPPLSKIPLHDHPGMCVLSRVLYGELQRKSLDLAREQPNHHREDHQPQMETKGVSSWIPWTRSGKRRRDSDIPEGSKLAYRNRVDNLRAPDCTILFPFEGNLHEFVAGPHGAAVLDVLLPPYDHQHHRDCTFYEISECSPLEKMDSHRDKVWITPTGQPEDFHCISGSYDHLE